MTYFWGPGRCLSKQNSEPPWEVYPLSRWASEWEANVPNHLYQSRGLQISQGKSSLSTLETKTTGKVFIFGAPGRSKLEFRTFRTVASPGRPGGPRRTLAAGLRSPAVAARARGALGSSWPRGGPSGANSYSRSFVAGVPGSMS